MGRAARNPSQRAQAMGFAERPGKKSMVGWIGRRASFETAALRPPQNEESS
jgi:hypothetical protein